MKDKKEIKMEIVNWLCGDDELSEKFITLLEAGGLTEEEGKIIRNKLVDRLDSNYNFDLLFEEYYIEQLKDREDYPFEAMRAYTSDDEYLQLLDKHFPQTVSEAVDIVIGMLDDKTIEKIRNIDRHTFRVYQHFGLGLFMRNHFGINLRQSRALYSDILEKSGRRFLMSDDISGYLLEEVWDEIQRR